MRISTATCDYLCAFHRTAFTWRPRLQWAPGWRGIWWLWFEASYAHNPPQTPTDTETP